MSFNVHYKEGDIYNDRVVTMISVSRQMNPRRENRFGHYIYWKNLKNNTENRCNFSSFGMNNKSRGNVQVGVNDIATVAPWMIPWFKDKTVPYTHTVQSNHKVDWICPHCGAEIKNRTICNFYNYKKVICPNCSDGISYGERFLSNLLNVFKIKFDTQKSFNWSEGKIYDFYIPEFDMIVETHGKQHYTNTWSAYVDSKSNISIQDNDKYKKRLAIKNNIKNYVVIDCTMSDFDYIKNSIMSSILVEFLDFSNVYWEEIEKKSLRSVFSNVIDFLNSGGSKSDAAIMFHISEHTVYEYLKRAKKLGLLNSYSEKLIRTNNYPKNRKHNTKL